MSRIKLIYKVAMRTGLVHQPIFAIHMGVFLE